MTVVSPFLTFPAVSWWVQVQRADVVLFDTAEHFEKMSMRNRYRISGANNPILLSVPLVHGREQRLPMAEVRIHNDGRWQVQHWRTLVSVYKRTPYFEFYEISLKQLFDNSYDHLTAFNKAGIEWVRAQLKMTFDLQETNIYQKEYPADIADLRRIKKPIDNIRHYYQVFEDRIGFQQDLSILDLLFSEGPGAVGWL